MLLELQWSKKGCRFSAEWRPQLPQTRIIDNSESTWMPQRPVPWHTVYCNSTTLETSLICSVDSLLALGPGRMAEYHNILTVCGSSIFNLEWYDCKYSTAELSSCQWSWFCYSDLLAGKVQTMDLTNQPQHVTPMHQHVVPCTGCNSKPTSSRIRVGFESKCRMF